MKILGGIMVFIISIGLVYFGVDELSKHIKENGFLVDQDRGPIGTKAMMNIAETCGVKGGDLLWTIAMEKISKCIDELKDAQSVSLIIGQGTYEIPRDGVKYRLFLKNGKLLKQREQVEDEIMPTAKGL